MPAFSRWHTGCFTAPVLPRDPVGDLYEAAMGATPWPHALDRIAHGLGARAACVSVSVRGNGHGREVSFGLSTEELDAVRAWVAHDLEAPFGSLSCREEQPGIATLVASARSDPERICLSVLGWREWSELRSERLSSLADHVRRAVRLECEVRCAKTEADALLEEVERRQVGWVVVDSALRARRHSRVASTLRADDGVCLRPDGTFWTSDARLARRLRALLDGRRAGEAEPLFVARSGARPLMVSTRLVGARDGVLCARQVAVVIRIPDAQMTCGEPYLRAAYGLTGAEARLARLLVEGVTLREAADQAGVSMNTARTHLKRVFAKTQTRRQSELVSFLQAGLAVPR